MRTRFDEFCKDLVGAVMEHGGPVSREHHVVGPGLDIDMPFIGMKSGFGGGWIHRPRR